MVACGDGYVNPQPGIDPELDAFLAVQRDEITLLAGPGDTSTTLAADARCSAPIATCITTVGWTWWLQGSGGLVGARSLYGLFFASTVVLLFAVFRQGMGALLSRGLLADCPGGLATAHRLPRPPSRLFEGAVRPGAGVVCRPAWFARPLTFRHAALLAAGRRTAERRGDGLSQRSARGRSGVCRVAARCSCITTVSPAAGGTRRWCACTWRVRVALSPMLSIYRTGGGSSSQHLIVLGLGEPFNEELGLDDAGIYEVELRISRRVRARADQRSTRRAGSVPPDARPVTASSTTAPAPTISQQVARNFPADMLTRGYASAIRVLELPYQPEVDAAAAASFSTCRTRIFVDPRPIPARAGAGVAADRRGDAVRALTVMSLRVGLFVMLLVLYLSAYPAIAVRRAALFPSRIHQLVGAGFCRVAGRRIAVRRCMQRRRSSRGSTAFGHARLAAGVHATRSCCGWSGSSSCLAPLLRVAPVPTGTSARAVSSNTSLRRWMPARLHPVPQGNGYVRFAPPMSRRCHARRAETATRCDRNCFCSEFGGPACDSLKLDAVFRYDASAARITTSAARWPCSRRCHRRRFGWCSPHTFIGCPVHDGHGRLVARLRLRRASIFPSARRPA